MTATLKLFGVEIVGLATATDALEAVMGQLEDPLDTESISCGRPLSEPLIVPGRLVPSCHFLGPSRSTTSTRKSPDTTSSWCRTRR
ncbi:hypothetical protein GWK26_01085 [haloarchaeon 3A1-DGR]|nr:hypothetical protein GWK26_01085 [haloarchaeon 3A1-DGR]